jgi:hypothetical protein
VGLSFGHLSLPTRPMHRTSASPLRAVRKGFPLGSGRIWDDLVSCGAQVGFSKDTGIVPCAVRISRARIIWHRQRVCFTISSDDLTVDFGCSWNFLRWLEYLCRRSLYLSELISMGSSAPRTLLGIRCRSNPHLEGWLMFDQDRFLKIASRPNAEDGEYRFRIQDIDPKFSMLLED